MAGKTTKKVTEGNTKEFKLNQVLALWKKTSKSGNTFFTGKAGDDNVVGFYNGKKKNPKEPDLRVYKVDSEGKAEKEEMISLWAKVSKKGTKYLSGKLGDKFITGFIRTSDNERAPYITVYFSEELNSDSEGAENQETTDDGVPF